MGSITDKVKDTVLCGDYQNKAKLLTAKECPLPQNCLFEQADRTCFNIKIMSLSLISHPNKLMLLPKVNQEMTKLQCNVLCSHVTKATGNMAAKVMLYKNNMDN